jgi:ABC-type sugar transport system substrate-binding protein
MRRLVTTALSCTAIILSALPTSAQDKKAVIGMSVPALQNPFWRSFADFGTGAATALGAETVVVDANQSDAKQLADIEGLVAQGVGCLIITPNTSAIAKALLAKAESAQIPVVFAERYPGFGPQDYDGKSYAGFVGVDNKLAGYNIAKALYDGGVRDVVAIGGAPGGAVADERSAGLHQFLDEHKDMKLLQELRNGELRQDGYTDAQNFLSAMPGPGFQGLWTYNDDTALGAIKAFKDAKVIDKVKVASMDLIPEAVEAIKAGEALYSTGGQWAESGEAAVMCYDALNGKTNNPPVNQLSIPGVTKHNVDAYAKQFIEATPTYDWKSLSQVHNPNARTTDFVIAVK